jgi:hypothetical protein
VLVPGLTDDLDDIRKIAEFAAGLRQRRARRGAAVPSDGAVQVEAAWHQLSTWRKRGRPRRRRPSEPARCSWPRD